MTRTNVLKQPPNSTIHDVDLASAIVDAAGVLRFDNKPGSLERQCTLGLFVAALSDRLTLSFPRSADALKAVVFSPATRTNPAAPDRPRVWVAKRTAQIAGKGAQHDT